MKTLLTSVMMGFGMGMVFGAESVLRDLAADRPDTTESPISVDRGYFQIEADWASVTTDRWTVERLGEREREWQSPVVNLKYGILEDADVQLVVEPWRQRTLRSGEGKQREEGFGDMTLRWKQNFWGNDGGADALGMIFAVKIPTASGDLGNGQWEGSVTLPYAVELSEKVSLGTQIEVGVTPSGVGSGYEWGVLHSVVLGWGLTEKWGIFTELVTEGVTERGADWAVTSNVGVTYQVTANWMLDLGVGYGLTRAAVDERWFSGFTVRF